MDRVGAPNMEVATWEVFKKIGGLMSSYLFTTSNQAIEQSSNQANMSLRFDHNVYQVIVKLRRTDRATGNLQNIGDLDGTAMTMFNTMTLPQLEDALTSIGEKKVVPGLKWNLLEVLLRRLYYETSPDDCYLAAREYMPKPKVANTRQTISSSARRDSPPSRSTRPTTSRSVRRDSSPTSRSVRRDSPPTPSRSARRDSPHTRRPPSSRETVLTDRDVDAIVTKLADKLQIAERRR